jgi:ABC-type branched-subunit amino acid transport system substrate-binding protein
MLKKFLFITLFFLPPMLLLILKNQVFGNKTKINEQAYMPATTSVASVKAYDSSYPKIPIEKQGSNVIIPFCTSFPLQGDNKIVSRKMVDGIGSYLREFRHFINQAGSDKNTKLSTKKFIFKHEENNQEQGEQGVKNIKRILKKTPLFLGFIGTESFLSIKPQIKNDEICILFPINGLKELRDYKFKNVVYFRPSHEKELAALSHYAVKVRQKNNVAILYEASKWGKWLMESCKSALKKHGITSVVEASYPQETVEIEDALKIIAKKSPNAIFCIAKARPAYTFIRHALDKGINSVFLGFSHLQPIQKIFKTALGVDVAVTSVVPNAKQDTELKIVQEYRKGTKSFTSFRADSPFYLEAHINFELLSECLKRIEGDVSVKKIIQTFETFKNMNFKGLQIDFNEEDRSLSQEIWISPGDGRKWLKYKNGESSNA